jgi:hypothetical protein
MPSGATEQRKTVAIVQSNYIPWKGYFDLINCADEFILYDDMQFTRRDWRNRNRIKTRDGIRWITIPVEVKGRFLQKINETQISDPDWGRKHLETIRANYARAPFFRYYEDWLTELYLNTSSRMLSQINYRFLTAICMVLGIKAKISWSSDYRLCEGKTERLVDLCRQARASRYLSGPAARSYIDETLFNADNITVVYMDYADYPEYSQLFPPFAHAVSIVDLLCNVGPDAPRYMKSFVQKSTDQV